MVLTFSGSSLNFGPSFTELRPCAFNLNLAGVADPGVDFANLLEPGPPPDLAKLDELELGNFPGIPLVKPLLVKPLLIEPLLIEPLLVEPLLVEPLVIEPLVVEPLGEFGTPTEPAEPNDLDPLNLIPVCGFSEFLLIFLQN